MDGKEIPPHICIDVLFTFEKKNVVAVSLGFLYYERWRLQ